MIALHNERRMKAELFISEQKQGINSKKSYKIKNILFRQPNQQIHSYYKPSK